VHYKEIFTYTHHYVMRYEVSGVLKSKLATITGFS